MRLASLRVITTPDDIGEVDEGQVNQACCSPRGRKESDTTERLNKEQQRSLKGGNQWRDFMGGSGECSLRHKSRRSKCKSWSFHQDLCDLD